MLSRRAGMSASAGLSCLTKTQCEVAYLYENTATVSMMLVARTQPTTIGHTDKQTYRHAV